MKDYKIGDIIFGKVTGIEKYGIFVSLENNIDGLIHISEISDSFVRSVGDYVDIDEVIKVKIIDIDAEKRHVKLSIKGLDYRNNSNRSNHKIRETGQGFNTLKSSLTRWIDEKMKEITKK